MADPLRHRQTKGAATDMVDLTPPRHIPTLLGQDPGQAGKSQALHLVRALSGFTVAPAPESGDKLTRFGPSSSQCRAGNVTILRGAWNEELFRVLEGFPDLAHDDEVDACSGALEMLNPQMKGWGLFELYRQKAEALAAEKAAAERGEEYVPPPIENQPLDLMEVYRKTREYYEGGQNNR